MDLFGWRTESTKRSPEVNKSSHHDNASISIPRPRFGIIGKPFSVTDNNEFKHVVRPLQTYVRLPER
jgi:hypothetical protein